MRERILKVASSKFFRHGFHRVSVAELAGELKVSKSTLYEHFASKQDLVRAVVDGLNDDIDRELAAILEEEGDMSFPEQIEAVIQQTGRTLSRVEPPFWNDLRERAPDLWQRYEGRREERLERFHRRLLRRGVEQGRLRSDVDLDFLLLVYTKLNEIALRPSVFQDLPVASAEAHRLLTSLFLEGALTAEGRAALET